jgi:S-adenosylmethionine:tRNA ribosyltransferase-isomerase
MRVDLFDYALPPERIALSPAEPRESARLLQVPALGPMRDLVIADLPSLIRPGDALVVNDTRVIPARLDGVRVRGEARAHIEATLLKRLDASRWRALVRPAQKLKQGERVSFGETNASAVCWLDALDATVEEKGENGEIVFAFDLAGAALDEALERVGQTPLPPYIAARRDVGPADRAAYQTLFANEPGAVAAPTAGLHFTPALIGRLEAAGASLHKVTLHVGGGTFLPVKVEDTAAHRMHSEWGRLDAGTADALNQTRSKGGRIVAIGTTSLRLESAADADGRLSAFEGETDIFITPGYAFRAVEALFTNFHLPRSTLLMLVCAFAGRARILAAYQHAIAAQYRFYSYGDACFLERGIVNEA